MANTQKSVCWMLTWSRKFFPTQDFFFGKWPSVPFGYCERQRLLTESLTCTETPSLISRPKLPHSKEMKMPFRHYVLQLAYELTRFCLSLENINLNMSGRVLKLQMVELSYIFANAIYKYGKNIHKTIQRISGVDVALKNPHDFNKNIARKCQLFLYSSITLHIKRGFTQTYR